MTSSQLLEPPTTINVASEKLANQKINGKLIRPIIVLSMVQVLKPNFKREFKFKSSTWTKFVATFFK